MPQGRAGYSSPRLDAVRADIARRQAMRGLGSATSAGDDTTDPFAGLFDDTPLTPRDQPAAPVEPPPQVENDPASPGWKGYAGMAIRGLGALIPGGPWGALGAGAAEFAAEKTEGRDINPWQIAAQAGIGAIPFANWLKGGKLLGTIAKGAAMGAGSTTVSSLAEGHAPSLQDLETSALVGGGTAGAFKGLSRAMSRETPAAARVLTAEERVPPVARVAAPLEDEAVRMARAHQPTMNFDVATPEQGSQLAQDAILGAHATAARYSKLQAAMTASQGKTSALIDRLSAAARRAEERASGVAEPNLAGARQPLLVDPVEYAVTHKQPGQPVPPSAAAAEHRAFMAETNASLERDAQAIARENAQAQIDRLTGRVRRAEAGGEPSLAGATQRPMFSPDELSGGAPRATRPSLTPNLDDLLHTLAPDSGVNLEHVTADGPFTLNGSGESVASMEALNRQTGMRAKGERFVVYDRAGNKRPLIGPDAVDYHVQPGETYGVEGPNGFMKLDDAGGRVPTAGAGAVVPPSPPPVSPAGPKSRIPPEITALWQDLKPKWQASLDAQAGDNIPFTVDPHEDLLPFARRVLSDDPRQLMGAERGVRKALDAEGRNLETGNISPELLVKLGLTAGGGAIGATADKEHPLRGALLGAGGGLALSHAPSIAENAEALRYFGMLSGPATQAKNIVGNMGAVAAHALETGDTKPVRELFASQTLNDLVKEFRAPQPGRWGQTQGVLGLPGRAMGAVDSAAKDALARAGISREDARLITFTNNPRSATGKAFVDFTRRAPGARMVVPFSQTATNLVERGIERTPGLGIIADLLSKGQLKTSVAKQLLGTLAVASGSQIGSLSPVLQAALAPYALPYQIGAAGGAAFDKGKSAEDVAMSAWDNGALDLVPAPMNKRAFDPRQWLAQMVPNIVKDLSLVDPKTLDQGSVPFFGPALAKIPFLNEAILSRKRPSRSRPTGRLPRRR